MLEAHVTSNRIQCQLQQQMHITVASPIPYREGHLIRANINFLLMNMADSYTLCISKIDQFLRENEEFSWKKNRDPCWSKRFIETHLQLLKTFVCYTGKWSDEDKATHLGSPSTDLEPQLNSFVDYVSGVIFTRPDYKNESSMMYFKSSWVSLHFQVKVGRIYNHLLSVPHPPISDYLVFSQFAACVQEYVVSLSLELQRHVQCCCRYVPYEWQPSDSRIVGGYYAATAKKLEGFRSFICSFAQQCIDQEKLHNYLGRAGALVLSVARVACGNQIIDRYARNFPLQMVSGSSDLSRKLSRQNQEVVEIYHEVLGAYVEIIGAAKPSSGPFISLAFEDLVRSYVTILQLVENQVDVLVCVLDNLSLNPVVKLDDLNKEMELLLRHGVSTVAREAGSLGSTLPDIVLSKLWHKLNLIKAEIFVMELDNQKANLMVSVYNPVATISEAFRFLSKFFKTPEIYMEDREKFILALFEALVREAGSSNQAHNFTEDMIYKSSLAIFKLFKAEAMLLVLIDNKTSLKFLARYRIETLQKSLIFLRALLSDPPNGDLEDGELSTIIAALASEATTLVCSFGNNRMEKNQPKDIDLLPIYLSRNIELNFAEIKAVYRPSPWSLFSNFPKSDGFVFVDFLLAKLREFLVNYPDIATFVKDQVELLLGGLEFLWGSIKDVQHKNNESEDLGARVVCLIYEAEYIINLFVVGDVPGWYQQLVLFNAVEETNLIKAQIQEYYNGKRRHDATILNVRQTSGNLTSEARSPGTDEVIVGFDDQAKILMDQLETGSQQLQIVSIVGMAGLGKTTLAKKVYNSLSIQHHFIVRAWCYVSQVYQKRELLLDMLEAFVEVTDQIRRMDDEGIAKTLYQKLKGKRYLIVMDDIWSIEPWNDLRISLPDDRKGSRILFTSRVREVALQREPHLLPLLSVEKSWDLLKERLFHGGSCPNQLLGVGRHIAENCKGLPLALVVMAGLLKKIEKRKDRWEEIAKHLRSHITGDRERQFMDILEFSYNYLPSYLKPCFLYLGIFLEDHEISVQKLKRLWIAEGFIPKMASKSLEETAESYLVELIGRSLVMEAKRRSRGGTKTCRMHDMLRDLCLEKARKENFMQLISMSDAGNSDSPVCVLYRLCVHSPRRCFIRSKPFGPHVHSLQFFPIGNKENRHFSDISFIFQNFKLLRVLDLEYIIMDEDYVGGIELMLCLTYLAIRGNMTPVLSSLVKLFNLETLILKGTRGEIAVPSTLWTMPKLRHVQVHPRAAFSNELENSMVLDNLVTLSSPTLFQGKEAEKLLRRLIGLKKLRCVFLKNWDDARMCNVFPEMAFLDQLESLKIFYYDKISFPCKFSFPRNLKKLALSKFHLPWEYISAIRQLDNLEVLKLLSNAFEGPTWDMTEGEFPNLKYLKLEHLNLANWNASGDQFPQLERLVLHSCKNLEEVPYGFGEIPTLQMIEMHWCSSSAVKSVEAISDRQLELENKEYKVLITRSEHL